MTEDAAKNTPLPPKPPPPYYAADCLNAPTPTNTDTTPPPWQLPPKHPPSNSPPPKVPSSSGAAQPAPSKRPSSGGVAQPSAPPEHRDAHNTITHTVALAPNKAKTKPGAKWMPPKRPPATPPPQGSVMRYYEVLVMPKSHQLMNLDGTPVMTESGIGAKSPPPVNPMDLIEQPVQRLPENGVPENCRTIIVDTWMNALGGRLPVFNTYLRRLGHST